MTYLSHEQRFFSVDKGVSIPFETFYKENTDKDVQSLSQEEFQQVYDLPIGQSLWFGMGVEVKRTK